MVSRDGNLRVVRAADPKGVKHVYARIVEAYRENGKNKHRTIVNLGRKDLLAAQRRQPWFVCSYVMPLTWHGS
jgi:hypothetical protein